MSLDNTLKLQKLAAAVVYDSDQLTDIWAQLNYYSTNGVMRDDSSIQDVNIEDLELSDIITRLLTLPSFITKTKKKLASMHDTDEKTALEKLVKQKEKELQAIKNLRFKK